MATVKAIVAQYQAAGVEAKKARDNDFIYANFNINITGMYVEPTTFVDYRTGEAVNVKAKVVFTHRDVGKDVRATFYAKNCPALFEVLKSSKFKVSGRDAVLKKPITVHVQLRVLKPEAAEESAHKFTPRVVIYDEGEVGAKSRDVTGDELFGGFELSLNSNNIVYLNKPVAEEKDSSFVAKAKRLTSLLG